MSRPNYSGLLLATPAVGESRHRGEHLERASLCSEGKICLVKEKPLEVGDPARPHLQLQFGTLEYALEASAALLLAIFLFVAAVGWRELPTRVPIHFGFDGTADAWGSRSSSLWLPLITVLLYVLLTVVSRFPYAFNYPMPTTPENAETQYRLAIRLLLVLKNMLVVVFLAIYIGIWATSTGVQRGLSVWFLPMVLFCLIGPIVVYLRRASRPANR